MEKKVVDRRIQRTRRLLQDALLELILEKGYEAVTVQDVIDRADVGRSTFYAHFQDKDDLLLSGFEHLRGLFEEHLTAQPPQNGNPWALSLAMFQHAESHRALYKALAGRQGGDIALAHVHKYFSAYLHDHLKLRLSKKKRTVPPDLVAYYIASSFISLLAWWLDTDPPYSAEQMNDFYRQLIQPAIESML